MKLVAAYFAVAGGGGAVAFSHHGETKPAKPLCVHSPSWGYNGYQTFPCDLTDEEDCPCSCKTCAKRDGEKQDFSASLRAYTEEQQEDLDVTWNGECPEEKYTIVYDHGLGFWYNKGDQTACSGQARWEEVPLSCCDDGAPASNPDDVVMSRGNFDIFNRKSEDYCLGISNGQAEVHTCDEDKICVLKPEYGKDCGETQALTGGKCYYFGTVDGEIQTAYIKEDVDPDKLSTNVCWDSYM